MRTTARLALVAAVAAVVMPTAPAHATYCGPVLDDVCYRLCQVYQTLDRTCPR